MVIFRELVAAIEENNDINDGKWSDWDSVEHIEDVYGSLTDEFDEVSREFLSALIRSEGENLQIYFDAHDCLKYGQAFSGNRTVYE